MMFATGDCHGNFMRFGSKYFPEQKKMGRSDYVIICGDFGGVWNGNREEAYWLDWLNDKPWTTLWVDGNHENYCMLRDVSVERWNGGSIQRIRSNILHLMRGQLYEINGCTFFTMGGTASHDIEDGILDPNSLDFEDQYRSLMRQKRRRFRILGETWWPEEMPSDQEYDTALETLERANWEADYVITHCAPTSVALAMSQHNEPDRLTDFLEMVNKRMKFHYWLFGHYHDNKAVDNKHILLWEQIVQVM